LQTSGHGLDPAEVRDAPGLCRLLNQLWIIAGKPSLRTVEAGTTRRGGKLPHTNMSRVQLHRSTLSLVLKGQSTPTKAFYLTFVEYCGIDLAEDRTWERAWDAVALAGTAVAAPEEEPAAVPEAGDAGVGGPVTVAVVSCDIVGHATAPEPVQLRNIDAINRIVAGVIDRDPTAVWASGGDGGHLVFRSPEWPKHVTRLVTELQAWSRKSDTSLRITAHHGRVVVTVGADGRTQFVGEGINTAGRILAIGMSSGVLVSAVFGEEFEKAGTGLGVRFHSPRTLIGKKSTDMPVYLMSADSVASRWPTPVEGVRADLAEAIVDGDGWAILLHAKRVMQVNPHDPEAVDAVHQVFPGSLSVRAAREEVRLNPLLSYLDPEALHEILQLGELVERDRDEVICRYGDRGDSMFVVLSGRLGVAESEGRGTGGEPEIVMNAGDIAGELAFALERPRTAGLVALTDVVLLSLRAADVVTRLSSSSFDRAREALQRFVNARVLEHITYNAPYLVGDEQDGPLTAGHRPVRDALRALATGSRLIALDPIDLQLTFDRVTAGESSADISGLYILASGEVGIGPEQSGAGDIFPVLWARVPGVLDRTAYRYTLVNDPVKVLHIRGGALAGLEPAKRAALYSALSAMTFPADGG
jgi:hypothetical protein